MIIKSVVLIVVGHKRVTPQNVGDELQDKIKLNEEPQRKRHGCVTTYIFISLFVGIITSVIAFFPKEFWGSRFPDVAVLIPRF